MGSRSFLFGNAAGFLKTEDGLLRDILRAPDVTHVTLGSYTLFGRDGNPEPSYWDGEDGTSVNALGLPNNGMDKGVVDIVPIITAIRAASKRSRISVAGFSIEEYRLLVRYAKVLACDEVEVNLGCPNVRDRGTQHPIAAFDIPLIESIMSVALDECGDDGPSVAVKLSPYSDPGFLKEVASAIIGLQSVFKVVVCNTFPNGLAFKDGRQKALSQPYGGVGGTAMRHIALGQVAQFAECFKDTDIEIIGVGGISRGQDLLAMKEAGASGVQVGTAFGKRGARIFSEILAEEAALTE